MITNYQKAIKETLAFFEYKEKTKEDGVYILSDNAPQSLRDSVHKAHGDRLPDDWIYQKYFFILDALRGYDIEGMDDIDEQRAEIVDGLVDVYTTNLTAWLASHNGNIEYMIEAQEELGKEDNRIYGAELLMLAQYKAIDEIYSEVASYIEEATECITASDERAEAEAEAKSE